jgi:hypothetical protein
VTKDVGLSGIMRLSTSTKSFVPQWDVFDWGKPLLGNPPFVLRKPLNLSATCQAGPLHSDNAVDSAEHIHSSNNLAELVANRGTDLIRTCCDMLRH